MGFSFFYGLPSPFGSVEVSRGEEKSLDRVDGCWTGKRWGGGNFGVTGKDMFIFFRFPLLIILYLVL